MREICVLGCGWLGFPLAKKLVQGGSNVKGSTTSKSKLTLLNDADINGFALSISENTIHGDITDFLRGAEVLILNIPPGLKRNADSNFVAKISTLIPFIEKASINKVLFVSSTSVYANDNVKVTTHTEPKPTSESGRQLLVVENLLLKNKHFKTTVIRFAGLIGKDRHPIHSLAGRRGVKNADAPINLIHLDDCISLMQLIIAKEKWGNTYNAAHPDHHTKKEYYTRQAEMQNLKPPVFAEGKSKGKIIDSSCIMRDLDFSFTTSI
jgi:nucleoside-diphosphate-sugar epimerase